MTRAVPKLLAISDPHERVRLGLCGDGDTGAPLEAACRRWLRSLIDAGVDTVQLREGSGKPGGLDDRRVLELATALVDEAHRHGPPTIRVVINGRADIALASGAAGVHLPAAGVPVAALRRRFGDRLLIGKSTHHPDEVRQARADGADYVTFGPVFPTPSKAGYGPPPGLEGLAEASRHGSTAPESTEPGSTEPGFSVLALGGVDADRIDAIQIAGAHGVAGIRTFHEPEALERIATAARRAWPNAVRSTASTPSRL